jgi:hypothetical protein
MAARATLALKPGVWFRRGRLLIVSPDSLGTACPLSGRNSTYRLVQILEAGSFLKLDDLTFGPGPFRGDTFTASREIQMFKVGLNYRFGSLFGGGYGGSY